MKFNKLLCVKRSEIEGSAAYEHAMRDGTIEGVSIRVTSASRGPGWEIIQLGKRSLHDADSTEPLETSAFMVAPREPYVDELTRHRFTHQIFIPVTGPILAVSGESTTENPDEPDLRRTVLVPVIPGEGVLLKRGAWHTLPFTFEREVVCMSVMHRETVAAYHDIRDLLAERWVGVVRWSDPSA